MLEYSRWFPAGHLLLAQPDILWKPDAIPWHLHPHVAADCLDHSEIEHTYNNIHHCFWIRLSCHPK